MNAMREVHEPPPPDPPTVTERLVLAAILLGGAGLMLAWPDAYVLTMDTAEISEMGRRIVSGQELPLAGTQVASGQAGRWLGPLLYYVCALPFVFSSDVLSAVLLCGLAWLFSGLLLHGAARVLWGPRVALAATALFFAGAQSHLEHRLNVFAVLAIVTVLLIVRACVEWGPGKRPAAIGWVVAAVGLAVQIHIVHLAFVVIVVATAWAYRPRWDRRAAALGLLVPLLLQLPWGIEQLRTGGQDLSEALGWLLSRGRGGAPETATIAPWSMLLAATTAPFRVPLDTARLQGVSPSWITHVSLAASGVLSAVGAAVGVGERRWRKGGLLLLAWWTVPIALMLIGRNGVYSFHLVAALPALAVFAALGIERLCRKLPRSRALAVASLVGVIVAGQGLLVTGVAERVAAQGRMRLPMSMVLSYPDALYRFPLRIEFPSLAGFAALEAALRGAELPPTVSGRVHGSEAMAFSFTPPWLPNQDGSETRPVPDGAATHHVLLRGAPCEGPLLCLREVDGAIYRGWTAEEEGESRPIGFPVALRDGSVFERRLPPGQRVLQVVTLGPTPHGMEQATPPDIEVRLDGRRLEPFDTVVSTPFWIRAERHYRIHNPSPASLAIVSRTDARVVLDLAVTP